MSDLNSLFDEDDLLSLTNSSEFPDYKASRLKKAFKIRELNFDIDLQFDEPITDKEGADIIDYILELSKVDSTPDSK